MRWLALALLGILVAAAVSIAASRLVSQQIGLASEPISAGDALAPQVSRANRHRSPSHTSPKPVPAPQPEAEPAPEAAPEPETTTPAPPAQPTPESHDDGHGSGGGSSEGPDD